jgi:hypothetical protein
MKLARFLKKRLLRDLKLRQSKMLVKVVETLYYERKERKRQRELRRQRLLKMRNQREYAATQIQRHIRGYLQRKRFIQLKSEYIRRKNAAIRIQTRFRRFYHQKRYQSLLARHYRAKNLLQSCLLTWYRKSQYQKVRQSVIISQSFIRMSLQSRRFFQLKREKYFMEKENLILSHESMNFIILLSNEFLLPFLSPSSKSTEEKSSEHLLQIFFDFCFSSHVLSFQKLKGFSLGSTLVKVISSVHSELQPQALPVDTMNVKELFELFSFHPKNHNGSGKKEKSYIVSKKKHLQEENEMMLKLVYPDLSLFPFDHHHLQYHSHSFPIHSSSSSSPFPSPSKPKNSRSEMKSSKEMPLQEKEIILDSWNDRENGNEDDKEQGSEMNGDFHSALPVHWNELKSVEIFGSESSQNQMILVNKFKNKIELKLVIKCPVELDNHSSMKQQLTTSEKSSSMKKKKVLELSKRKLKIYSYNFYFELENPLDNQSLESELFNHANNNLPACLKTVVVPFQEIIFPVFPSGSSSSAMSPSKKSSKQQQPSEENMVLYHIKVLPPPIIIEPEPEPEPVPSPPPEVVEIQLPPEEEPVEEEPEPSPLPPTPPKIIDFELMAKRIQVSGKLLFFFFC